MKKITAEFTSLGIQESERSRVEIFWNEVAEEQLHNLHQLGQAYGLSEESTEAIMNSLRQKAN